MNVNRIRVSQGVTVYNIMYEKITTTFENKS